MELRETLQSRAMFLFQLVPLVQTDEITDVEAQLLERIHESPCTIESAFVNNKAMMCAFVWYIFLGGCACSLFPTNTDSYRNFSSLWKIKYQKTELDSFHVSTCMVECFHDWLLVSLPIWSEMLILHLSLHCVGLYREMLARVTWTAE